MTGTAERTQRVSPAQSSRPRAAPRRLHSAVAYGGVLVLFVVAMLSASFAGLPSFIPPRFGAKPLPTPEPMASETIQPAPPPQHEDGPPLLMLVLATILILIVTAVLIFGLIWLIRLLLSYLRTRRPALRPGVATDGESSAELITEQTVDEPTIRRGISAARTAITSHAEPSDAIVAAWVGLEETAAASGTGRGASETPAEFTLRILLRRQGIEVPTRRLLSVYERVRFGGSSADESMRDEAESALKAIEEGWR